MRITSGIYKGRNIAFPKGIRPTQNKARKALFDILADVRSLSFLELFAGSGAVGIEALSRGAKDVLFVDSNSASIKALRNNLASVRYAVDSVREGEVLKVIGDLASEGRRFDIVFFDPPYYRDLAPQPYSAAGLKPGAGLAVTARGESLAKKTLQALSACDILLPTGFIIAQHFKKDSLPDDLGVLTLFKQSKYGDTLLSFYRKK